MRYLILALILTGCYGPKQARNQFAKAVAYDQGLAADYCATTYPVKETVIQGKDIVKYDTLWGEGEVITRTVIERVRDTVYTTRYLQGNTIRETVIRTDTIVKENTAALAAARIDNTRLTGLLVDKTAYGDKWREIARKRFWIIVALCAIVGIGLYFKIKKIWLSGKA